jgi:hypothetical protein
LFDCVKNVFVGVTELADRLKRFVRVFKGLLIAVNDSTGERSEDLVGEYLASLVHLFRELVALRVLEERFDLAFDYALSDRIEFLRKPLRILLQLGVWNVFQRLLQLLCSRGSSTLDKRLGNFRCPLPMRLVMKPDSSLNLPVNGQNDHQSRQGVSQKLLSFRDSENAPGRMHPRANIKTPAVTVRAWDGPMNTRQEPCGLLLSYGWASAWEEDKPGEDNPADKTLPCSLAV